MPQSSSQRHTLPAAAAPSALPAWSAAIFSISLFLACAWPFILTNNLLGRAAFDQLHYHEPVIRTFAAQWPTPDLTDYRSATTPGYHLFLALICRFFTDSGMALQLVSSLFTAAFLGLFAFSITRSIHSTPRAAALWGIFLTLPLFASIYVFFPGIWLVPDNLGWLFVLAVALVSWRIAASRGSLPLNFILAAALLLAVILIRQSHLWCAAIIWLSAWLGAAPIGDGSLTSVFSPLRRRIRALLPALLASLPAIIALILFAKLWGRLTPPTFAHQYASSINAATPAFMLALIGAFSLFFAGFIAPAAWRVLRDRTPALLIAMLAALVLAAIPDTTYSLEQRSTGLWNLVRILPVIADHTSPLLLIMAPLGAWATWAWFEALGPKHRWFFLGTLAAFTLAQTANPLCWQRYMEPLLLVMMGLGAASLLAPGSPPEAPGAATGIERFLRHMAPVGRIKGPILLTLLLALITIRSLLNPDIPWNTELGPDGRRRVVNGVLVIPGVRMEEQEHRIHQKSDPLPPSSPTPDDR